MTPINPDEAPEAPQPSPPLTIFMRVVENDAADDYDGGRLLMKPVRAGADPALVDASLVVSARSDDFLTRFPWKTRAAKANRFYRVTVEEVSASDLPPDPAAVAEAAVLEQRLAALKGAVR